MLKYIIKRIFLMVPTVFLLTIVIFFVIHLVPGDPITVMFGYQAGGYKEQIEEIKKFYNLDKPIYIQYFSWLGKVIQLDFGESIVRGDDINEMIAKRFPRTLILAGGSMLIALLVGIPLAIISARKHNTITDVTISGFSLTFISMPTFWLAILFILIFGVKLNVLPTTSHTFSDATLWGFLRVLIMPCVSTGLIVSAGITRMLRTELVDNLHKDYILFARTKGASKWHTLIKHNLRNAVIATSTVIGLQLGMLMGGVVIIERVFTFPGMGQLLLDAVSRRDYPIIQATVLVFSLTFVIINFLTDLLYAFLDPRIRYH